MKEKGKDQLHGAYYLCPECKQIIRSANRSLHNCPAGHIYIVFIQEVIPERTIKLGGLTHKTVPGIDIFSFNQGKHE